MIINKDNQICLEFGKGDIWVYSATKKVEGTMTGIMAFKDTEKPEPIGIRQVSDEVIALSQYPVYMTFTKVESIDAIITELSIIRSELLKK